MQKIFNSIKADYRVEFIPVTLPQDLEESKEQIDD